MSSHLDVITEVLSVNLSAQDLGGGKNVVREFRGGGKFWVQAIFGFAAVNNDGSPIQPCMLDDL